MGSLTRKEQINRELNNVLTGLLMEVFSGVTKKKDALELLEAMKAEVMTAVRAIDETADNIRNCK